MKGIKHSQQKPRSLVSRVPFEFKGPGFPPRVDRLSRRQTGWLGGWGTV